MSERRRSCDFLERASPVLRRSSDTAKREARQILTRLNVPVWSGQITQRTSYSLAEGEGTEEYESNSEAVAEFAALWNVIEKSVKAIHGACQGVSMHRVA